MIPDNLELKADQPDAAPTLEYLDSLRPKQKISREQRHRKAAGSRPSASATERQIAQEARLWEKTRDAINASFTRNQLARLAREAGISGDYSGKVTKVELIKRILVHRFCMEDVFERQERQKKEEREKFNEHIAFEPSEVFLLLAKGASTVRQQASRMQVVILPQAPPSVQASDNGLGFWIRAKSAGIAAMKEWAKDFKAKVQERDDQLQLQRHDATSSMDFPLGPLSPQLINYVARTARCYIQVKQQEQQGDLVELRLRYLDPQGANRAMLLLRQYVAEWNAASQRLGTAYYSDDLSSLRQCSMLPFIPNEPVPWMCDAQLAPSGAQRDVTFRVERIPDHDSFVDQGKPSVPSVRLATWDGKDMAEPFAELASRATLPNSSAAPETGTTKTFTATFGHVLFRGQEQATLDAEAEPSNEAAPFDPIQPPRPGLWPFDHLFTWLPSLKQPQQTASYHFVPASALHVQRTGTSLRSGLVRRGWSQNHGTQEYLSLTYRSEQPADALLDIQLIKDGDWKLHQAVWRASAETNMLLPDRPVDLRLESRTEAKVEHLDQIPEMTSFLDRLNDEASRETSSGEVAPSPAPVRLSWQDDSKHFMLERSQRLLRQDWHKLKQPEIAAEEAEIASEAAQEETSDNAHFFLDIMTDEGSDDSHDQLTVSWPSLQQNDISWQEVITTLEPLLQRFEPAKPRT